MGNKVVKYENSFGDIVLRGLEKNDLNVFFALCAKVQGKESEVIMIDYAELIELAKIEPKSNKQFTKDLKRMSKKILGASIIKESRLDFELFTIFKRFKTHYENEPIPYLEVSVNEDFTHFLNDLINNKKFTKFDLLEYLSFKSTYTQECFRQLKRFRATGFWKVSIDKFRELLDVPKSYKASDLQKNVFSPIVEELGGHYKHFKMKKITKKSGRGRPSIVSLEFYFDKEPVEKYTEGKYDGANQYEKTAITYTETHIPKKKLPKTGKELNNTPDWSNENYINKTSKSEKEDLQHKKAEILEKLRQAEIPS